MANSEQDERGAQGTGESTRRAALTLLGSGVAALAAASSAAVGTASAAASLAPPKDAGLVRLSSVVTPEDGGLYGALLPDFTRLTGYRVALSTGQAVFDPARSSQADVVLCHYGHNDIKRFMEDGLGEWPQTVFFNLLTLLGPSDDPAGIRNEPDLVSAFRRLASRQTPYVVNDTDGIKYLSETLWEAAGQPAKGSWYLEPQAQGPGAVALAAEKRGYTLWGLTPFLRMQGLRPAAVAPILLNDPLLQRIMVTVAVRADKVAGVNAEGVKALQDYLLRPHTQALIREFRLPGIAQQVWYPAGRNNAGALLGSN